LLAPTPTKRRHGPPVMVEQALSGRLKIGRDEDHVVNPSSTEPTHHGHRAVQRGWPTMRSPPKAQRSLEVVYSPMAAALAKQHGTWCCTTCDEIWGSPQVPSIVFH
tara:strand:- start:2389 stop:2706 length:318 start_codon:yes stop_codon:yes gene_type:complete